MYVCVSCIIDQNKSTLNGTPFILLLTPGVNLHDYAAMQHAFEFIPLNSYVCV